MNVSVDDSPECYWVEWNMDLEAAKRQIESRGFHGVEGLQKVATLNGNRARWSARNNAQARGCMYGWVGDYDVGVGKDSGLYFFSYSAYTGPKSDLWDARKLP